MSRVLSIQKDGFRRRTVVGEFVFRADFTMDETLPATTFRLLSTMQCTDTTPVLKTVAYPTTARHSRRYIPVYENSTTKSVEGLYRQYIGADHDSVARCRSLFENYSVRW